GMIRMRIGMADYGAVAVARHRHRRHFAVRNSKSQIPTQGLLAFYGLKQGLEVALAKGAGALPLNDLIEYGRSVLDRLGKDLEQISFVVAVHEDAELFECFQRLIDFTHSALQIVIVGSRNTQEL